MSIIIFIWLAKKMFKYVQNKTVNYTKNINTHIRPIYIYFSTETPIMNWGQKSKNKIKLLSWTLNSDYIIIMLKCIRLLAAYCLVRGVFGVGHGN